MGDIADWLLGSQDPFGWDDDDEGDGWYPAPRRRARSAPRAITCNRCGERNLWWAPNTARNRSSNWKLVTSAGDDHTCNTVQPGEFEDLTK